MVGQRPHEVRGQPRQAVALATRLPRDTQLTLADVAQTAMDELRGAARGAGGEVIALHEQRAQPTTGGVAQHPGAGDAAADHEQVDALALRAGELHRALG